MSITLYTQPQCPFCDIMKEMLDETGFTYYTINIKNDAAALNFIKEQGHRTVPQLYANDIHINKKTNTQDYTSEELFKLISEALEQEWPWQDSGVEQGM
jgi:glutaredoxin-like protein NrdH